MVKHIVMWKLKDEYKNRALELENGLEGLKNKVEVIKSIQVGINFNPSDNAFDLVLNSEFATKEDLDSYQKNPEHLKVATKVRESVCSRHVVDYEF